MEKMGHRYVRPSEIDFAENPYRSPAGLDDEGEIEAAAGGGVLAIWC